MDEAAQGSGHRPAQRSATARRATPPVGADVAPPPGGPIGVAVLGSTGSVGTQTLEVIAHLPERFRVVALAAGGNLDLLAEQAARFGPDLVVVADGGDPPAIAPPRVATGANGLIHLSSTTRPRLRSSVSRTSLMCR